MAQATKQDFKRGRRFKVIKDGGQLRGWQPVPGGQAGWYKRIPAGTILTCDGPSMTMGDGASVIKWRDENNGQLALDCEFKPSTGHILASWPDVSFFEPL